MASLFLEPLLAFVAKKYFIFLLLTLILPGQPISRAEVQPKLPGVSGGPTSCIFFHTHTRERLNIVYRNDEGYDQESLVRVNRYLRDHRTGEIMSTIPRYSTSSSRFIYRTRESQYRG